MRCVVSAVRTISTVQGIWDIYSCHYLSTILFTLKHFFRYTIIKEKVNIYQVKFLFNTSNISYRY